MQEELAEAAAEFFDAQVAFDDPAVANRDLPGFFRDHDGHGVGLLAEPEAGAVAEPEVAVEVLALGERKNAGGGDDAVAAEDEAPVVEHGLRLKQRRAWCRRQ